MSGTAARAANSSRYAAGNAPPNCRSSALPRASPAAAISASLRSSSQRRAACASCASRCAHVELGHAAGCRAHGDENARQRRFGQVDVELGAGAVESLHQDRLPLPAQLGVEVLPRRVDQAGKKSFERIAAHEQAKALPLAEMQDARHCAQQVVFGGLEQFVARVIRENIDQRLLGVTARRQMRARDDIRGLPAQQRDFGRIGAVRGRGEQAEETVLAAHSHRRR